MGFKNKRQRAAVMISLRDSGKYVSTKNGVVHRSYYKPHKTNLTHNSTKHSASSKRQLIEAVNRNKSKIAQETDERTLRKIEKINDDYNKGKDSRSDNSTNGVYTAKREKLHDSILDKQFNETKSVDKNDPDVYFFGGVGGSGKGTHLRPRVKENAIIIDPDNYKKELSKTDKSPVKGKKLAHAAYLHEESSDISHKARNRAVREKRDVIEDRTMSNEKTAKDDIDYYKRNGYDVHVLGTQLPAHKSIDRATSRFLNPKKDGRYVPLEIIGNKGNRINKNVIKSTKYGDSYQVYDTDVKKGKKAILITRSNTTIKKNQRNPKDAREDFS